MSAAKMNLYPEYINKKAAALKMDPDAYMDKKNDYLEDIDKIFYNKIADKIINRRSSITYFGLFLISVVIVLLGVYVNPLLLSLLTTPIVYLVCYQMWYLGDINSLREKIKHRDDIYKISPESLEKKYKIDRDTILKELLSKENKASK